MLHRLLVQPEAFVGLGKRVLEAAGDPGLRGEAVGDRSARTGKYGVVD